MSIMGSDLLLLEGFDAVAQLVKLLEGCRVLLPGRIVVDGKDAAVVARLEDRARNERAGRDVYMIGQREMAQDHGRSDDGAVGPDRGAARDAGAAGDRRVPADAHVMADLDQVVQLDAVLDDSVLQRAAVDAGIGADL